MHELVIVEKGEPIRSSNSGKITGYTGKARLGNRSVEFTYTFESDLVLWSNGSLWDFHEQVNRQIIAVASAWQRD